MKKLEDFDLVGQRIEWEESVNWKNFLEKNKLNSATISGNPGSGKSTFAKNALDLIPSNYDIPTFSHNSGSENFLELDRLMSVERGRQKMDFLINNSPEEIFKNFFRAEIFEKIIQKLNANEDFVINNAYNPSGGGKLNGILGLSSNKVLLDSKIILSEGVSAKAINDSIKDEQVHKTNILIGTNPAISLLYTVRRGLENPDRAKNPLKAFQEFYIFTRKLLFSYKENFHGFDGFIKRSGSDAQELLEFSKFIQNHTDEDLGLLLESFLAIAKKEALDQPLYTSSFDGYMVYALNYLKDHIPESKNLEIEPAS